MIANEPIWSNRLAQAGKLASRRRPKTQTLVSKSQRSAGVVMVSDFVADAAKL